MGWPITNAQCRDWAARLSPKARMRYVAALINLGVIVFTLLLAYVVVR